MMKRRFCLLQKDYNRYAYADDVDACISFISFYS